MKNLRLKLWHRFSGTIQWYILWFAHAKFVIGVSGVIFNEKGEVLLIKHRYRRRHAVWGLPSGHVERKESLEEALQREIFEETGYRVEIDTLLRLRSGYTLRIEASYVGRFLGGKLVTDPVEVEEVGFFSPNNLPKEMMKFHRELIRFATDIR